MKGIMKLAYKGTVIGGTLGALSGIKKKKGESNKHRAIRMLNRGITGATIGSFSEPFIKDLSEGRKRRASGSYREFKGDQLKEVNEAIADHAIGMGILGGVQGGIQGVISDGIKSHEGLTTRDYIKRVAKSGLKGGATGTVLGATQGAMIGAAKKYRGY